MHSLSNTSASQFSTSAMVSTEPIPLIAELGTLPEQFKAIEVFLAIPDHVRETDRDSCWSYVCDLLMGGEA